MENKNTKYYIYILNCNGDMLYTGITTDYKRRFEEHTGINGTKKGAKFTRAYKPSEIVALWETEDRSSALRLEAQIKKLKKEDKLSLIANNSWFKKFFFDKLDISKYKKKRKH